MKKMYRAYWGRIKMVVVERETDKYIFIAGDKGRRTAKRSNGDSYHDTWDKARRALLIEVEDEIDGYNRRIDHLAEQRSNILALKP